MALWYVAFLRTLSHYLKRSEARRYWPVRHLKPLKREAKQSKSYKEESVRIDYIPRVSPIAPWYEARAGVSLSQSEVYLAKIDFYLNIYIVFVL